MFLLFHLKHLEQAKLHLNKLIINQIFIKKTTFSLFHQKSETL